MRITEISSQRIAIDNVDTLSTRSGYISIDAGFN